MQQHYFTNVIFIALALAAFMIFPAMAIAPDSLKYQILSDKVIKITINEKYDSFPNKVRRSTDPCIENNNLRIEDELGLIMQRGTENNLAESKVIYLSSSVRNKETPRWRIAVVILVMLTQIVILSVLFAKMRGSNNFSMRKSHFNRL